MKALANYGNMVRRPQSQINICNKIQSATKTFIHEQQREPSAEELSEIIGLEVDKLEKALRSEAHVFSFDAPLADSEDTTMKDTLPSSPEYDCDRNVNKESMRNDVIRVLSTVLNEREHIVLVQSFGIGCNERGLEEIGQDLGLTRERVRQIRERGIEKMRQSSQSRQLLSHLS